MVYFPGMVGEYRHDCGLPALFVGLRLPDRISLPQGLSARSPSGLWVRNHRYAGTYGLQVGLAGWFFPASECPDAAIRQGLPRFCDSLSGTSLAQPELPELAGLYLALQEISPLLDLGTTWISGVFEGLIPLSFHSWPLLSNWPCVTSCEGPSSHGNGPWPTKDQAARHLVDSGMYWAKAAGTFDGNAIGPKEAELRSIMEESWLNWPSFEAAILSRSTSE